MPTLNGESQRSPESLDQGSFISPRLSGLANTRLSPSLLSTFPGIRFSLAQHFVASMGNMSESKTPTAESMSSITVETVDQTTPLITVTMAASLQTSRKLTTINTSTPVDSPPAPATEDESATPPLVRLIDSDPSKFRSLKRVIVIGHPGSGTDGKFRAFCDLRSGADVFHRCWRRAHEARLQSRQLPSCQRTI